jgi:glycosyltransferase involved in cell wall biosynthesis
MDKRIRILYTIPNFKTAGSQYVLLSLFRKIDKTAFDPYICIEKFPETVPNDISEKKCLVFKWTDHKFNNTLNFRKLLKNHEIDIVHSWDYKSNYFEALACRIAGVKYLYTKKNNAWSKRWKLKSMLANHIAYDNPEMKSHFFSSLLFQNKISFIPHGVDTSIFKPLEQSIRITFNIACIGNIGDNKNQLFIVKSLKDLPSDIHLYLYGNDERTYREKLNEYINSNFLANRVHFKGVVANNDIPTVYKNIDLFVLPSFQEGLPVSILEALACGVPVLSSDSGGGARFLLKKGGGILFDLEDPIGFTEHLKRLYQNPEERITLSSEGRKNVVANFTLRKEVVAYQELYASFKK